MGGGATFRGATSADGARQLRRMAPPLMRFTRRAWLVMSRPFRITFPSGSSRRRALREETLIWSASTRTLATADRHVDADLGLRAAREQAEENVASRRPGGQEHGRDGRQLGRLGQPGQVDVRRTERLDRRGPGELGAHNSRGSDLDDKSVAELAGDRFDSRFRHPAPGTRTRGTFAGLDFLAYSPRSSCHRSPSVQLRVSDERARLRGESPDPGLQAFGLVRRQRGENEVRRPRVLRLVQLRLRERPGLRARRHRVPSQRIDDGPRAARDLGARASPPPRRRTAAWCRCRSARRGRSDASPPRRRRRRPPENSSPPTSGTSFVETFARR